MSIKLLSAKTLSVVGLWLCGFLIAPPAAMAQSKTARPQAGQTRAIPAEPAIVPLVHENWRIPGPVAGTLLRAQILRPSGSGPFPLVVINHGSTANAQARLEAETPQFDLIGSWFARRNYFVLIPQRMGHGETGGAYLEDYGTCENPNYTAGARGGAASIMAAVKYAQKQPMVSPDSPILVGHSAGAWAALALASGNQMKFRAVINFSGGLGGHSYGQPNLNCAPERLI